MTLVDGICWVRPRGPSSLVAAVELVKDAIGYCREHRIDKLLFNSTGLTGLGPSTVVDRFLMIEEWALAAGGLVAVALVVPASRLHSDRFGEVLAEHLGFTGGVFTTEERALRWLTAGDSERAEIATAPWSGGDRNASGPP